MSDFKDRIDGLIEDTETDLDQNPDLKNELKNIQLSQQDEEQNTSQSDVERLREFTRAGTKEHQLSLRFKDSGQFARSYVENISLGGLFVKTTQKLKMGEIIDVAFDLPQPDSLDHLEIHLKGKVVNQRAGGYGLEFTNLDEAHRQQIESYIKRVIPEGAPLRQSKKTSLEERLQERRRLSEEAKAVRKKFRIQILVVSLLILVNLILGYEVLVRDDDQVVQMNSQFEFEVNGRKVQMSEVREIKAEKDGIKITTSNGDPIFVNDSSKLPYVLRKSAHLLKTLPPIKKARRSRNVPMKLVKPGYLKKHK